ncbi:MAG: hypothetical protein HYW02_04485 [Deltaproteobacteria bacterium]|nr:hypothetical protein [Deltaproteobacteria bacterium]MBI2500716.1 hypothetical protein [Deltaproteobacteria bacterium]
MAQGIISFQDKSEKTLLEGEILYSDGNLNNLHDMEAASIRIKDAVGEHVFHDTDQLAAYLKDKFNGQEVAYVRWGEKGGKLSPPASSISLDRFLEKHGSWWKRAGSEVAEYVAQVRIDQKKVDSMYGTKTFSGQKEKQASQELYQRLKRLGDGFSLTTLVDGDLSVGGLSNEEKAVFWERLKDRFPDSGDTEGVLEAIKAMNPSLKIGDAACTIDAFSLAEKDYHEIGDRLNKKEGDGVEGDNDVALGSIPSTPQNVSKQIGKIKKKIDDLLAILKLLIALGDTDMLALYLELYSLRKKLDGAKVSAHVADIQKARDENIDKLLKKAQDYEEKAARSEDRKEVTKYRNKAELIRNVIEGLRTLDRPLQMLADGMLEDAQQHSKTAEFARNMRSRDKGKFYG